MSVRIRLHHHYMFVCVVVKRDVQESDEEAVRVKEQSILELGGLLAKTGQAAGNMTLKLIWVHTKLHVTLNRLRILRLILV